MRLQMLLPKVEPTTFTLPTACPRPGCLGAHFRERQEVNKAVRDTVHQQVVARRYECLRCHRTFRVYPLGVTKAQVSLRVKGLAVMFYLLGLSYGAVSLVLEALGVYLCKSRVYDVVQAAAQRVPGLTQRQVFEGVKTSALGCDLTSVKCNGRWLPLGVTVDDTTGLVLTIDELSGEDAQTLTEWIAPIAEQVGAQLLVTDDADSLKTVAEEVGLDQQICKSHVKRNTEALTADLRAILERGSDTSLTALGITSEQARADLDRLDHLMRTRLPEGQAELETLQAHYLGATPPHKGHTASLAYRLHLLFSDRWNLWPCLTRYRTWRGPNGETIDGTNNACERGIGWWIKERYRSMRGYKRVTSAVNVSRLLAFCGNFLGRGGLDLATLVA
jgi:transposase-like protein